MLNIIPPIKSMGFYYVYVLLSQHDGNLYIGFTEDLQQRIKDHNEGKNRSTRSRRPLNLIYFEAHLNKKDALRRERYFKTTKGRTMLKKIFVNIF